MSAWWLLLIIPAALAIGALAAFVGTMLYLAKGLHW